MVWKDREGRGSHKSDASTRIAMEDLGQSETVTLAMGLNTYAPHGSLLASDLKNFPKEL